MKISETKHSCVPRLKNVPCCTGNLGDKLNCKFIKRGYCLKKKSYIFLFQKPFPKENDKLMSFPRFAVPTSPIQKHLLGIKTSKKVW